MKKKAEKSTKKAIKKDSPLRLDMTFEEALRKTITTKVKSKKAK